MTQKKKQKKRSSRRRDLQRRRRLLEGLPELEEILRGSMVERYRRCGRANCHCAREGARGHGPAYYLMVTVAPGETVQIYVPKEKRQEVERWVENFRQARETLEKVSTLNRRLLKQGELFD